VENPRGEINLASLPAPHQLQSARRMAAEAVALAAQDTTALSYSSLEQTQGLGPLGEDHGQGLLCAGIANRTSTNSMIKPWPVQSLKMARRLVRWYALRWGIEVWHGVLKLVCGVEDRQMKSAQALERALALDMIVASRALLLSRLGKEHPDLPAELFYSPQELEVLEVKKRKPENIQTAAS
jgi:hypothetical protein